MSARKAIIDKLKGVTAITDLVGTRIRPTRAEQGISRPYLVVRQTGGEGHYHAGGSSNLREHFLEVDCQATTQKQAGDLADLVRAEVDGTSGSFGSMAVRFCFWRGTSDSTTAPTDGGEVGLPAQLVRLQLMEDGS